ncbi:MAG: hypothetical protein A2148_00550 [Chloroflexi bacterium RBG_16_68_14]|nr:MAG: hypothetical protein A2148_00550 [Chloroflexi bacterium RBG_16_68_14]
MNTYRLTLRLSVVLLAVGAIFLAGLHFTPVEAQSIVIDDANNTMTVSGANAGTAIAIRGTVTNVSLINYPNAITAVFFREVAGDIALADLTLSWWTGAPGWQPAGPQFKPTNYPGYQMELNVGGAGFPLPAGFVGAGTWIRGVANRNFNTIEVKVITYVPNDANQQYNAGEAIISELGPIDTNIRIDLLGFNLETVYVDDNWAGCNVGNPALNIPTQEVAPGKFCQINAFDTIQGGIDNVAGSTVNVADGTYTATSLASIVITKDGLSLVGQSRDGTIIDGGVWGTSGAGWPKGIHVYANDVTIQNLTVRGFTGDMLNTGGYGILFRDYAHDMPAEGYIFYTGGLVDNVKVENNYSAIYALVTRNLTIRDSLVQNNFSDGMFIARESDNATITGNTVLNSGDHGIWVGYDWNAVGPSDNAIITGNVVDGAREGGISFVASDTALISGNDVSHVKGEEPEGTGGWSRGAISLKDGVSNVAVSDNVVHDNDGLGTGSGRGIGVDGTSSNITLTGNTVRDNAGGGIKVLGTTTGWTANYNSIYSNAGYGAENTTGSILDFSKNWWGHATGASHTSNPHGTGQGGDAVSDNVDFTPWYATSTTTPATEKVTVTHNPVIAVSDTIQGAIAAALSGDTLDVSAGTYVEVGQIVINKNLSIVGAGAGTTIIKPSADTGSGGDARGWFLVNAGKTFNLSDVTLDGTGNKVWQAIRNRGQGTVSDCAFTNIKYDESTSYAGTGMVVFGSPAMNVDVTNCTFSEIGRVGVLYYGSGVTGSTYSGNTYTGKGAGDWLDYAVEVGAGATATITRNTISGNTGVASVDGSTSAGILVTTYYGAGTTATITENFVSGSTTGVAVGYDASDTSVATVSNNSLTGNTKGVESTDPLVDASGNWWGANTPSGVAGQVSADVDYSPWLDSGTDTAPATPGFQGDFSLLHVDDDSPQTGATGRIQEGIDLVSASTVKVEAGTYTEQVTIDKSLTLTGDTSGSCPGPGLSAPVLDGGGAVGSAITIAGGVSNVTIQGFEITNYRNRPFGNAWTTGGIGSGVLAWNATAIDDVTVRDNYLHDLGWSAVLVGNEGQALHDNWLVECNEVARTAAYAIELTNTSNSSVLDNDVTGGQDILGETTDDSQDAILIQTQIHTGSGQTNAGITVDGNTISGPLTRAGIELLAWDSTNSLTANLHNVTVSNNSVTNDFRGVFLYSVGANANISDVDVTGNVLDGNFHGVQITDAAGGTHGSIDILGNDIINSTGTTSGVRLTSGTSAAGIAVHYNNIVGNALLGINHAGTSTLNAENNWWGACDGPGAPGGTGSGDGVSANVDFSPWLLGTCDKDGDLLTNDEETLIYGTDPLDPDTDGDGCRDGVELSFPANFGGLRNPLNQWDFFDFNGDKYIDAPNDILQVMLRYSANPALPYDARADRGPLKQGAQYPWNRTAPDGRIDAPNDILSIKLQYQHDCR